MKVYIIVANRRSFSYSELNTVVASFTTREQARKTLKEWYNRDLSNCNNISEVDYDDDKYMILYKDEDGEHEINVEIYESECDGGTRICQTK